MKTNWRAIDRKDFEKSQFEKLFYRIDESIKSTFNIQYRMHPVINEVIKQFYIQDGGLTCGLHKMESFHKNFQDKQSRYHGLNHPGFISPEKHVIWVNVNEPEMRDGTSRVNYGEIEAVRRVLNNLLHSEGFDTYQEWLAQQPAEEQQIGLISFYGKQIKELVGVANEFKERLPIRTNTVDRFQGMERDIIIVSMVRSNKITPIRNMQPDYKRYPEGGYPKQTELGFTESPNRLNVALSRARRLLIIVGNYNHFCQKEIYNNVYQTIKDHRCGAVIDYNNLTQYQNHAH